MAVEDLLVNLKSLLLAYENSDLLPQPRWRATNS